ncbi:hypothetical protein B0T26DRAFT_696025 [Lasiosphaeria miniovina]|uniref:DUF410-domain-containing protein n=1 Tax=Lasiosphaeria miniovina TaxID=1954250 RepID=A0AA40B5A3_9PEZI|nr:uncharacterized protein B0T26DRAFT_696025 [Lasiosphaeria miniovina]KAK0727902.1 hypothetical protein B0T26DRAFT_696025 [Lasiosphaeria miniovina]
MATRRDNKIEKIIARLQKRIAEGQFEEQYEAGQETRLVAARYTKTENWGAAIDILSSVSQALLKAGQGGSGGDLAVLLVDVYKQAKHKPDAESRAKLLTCLRLFDSEEPVRKKYIKEMMDWSRKFGDYPAGDPELHHVVGSLYADEHETDEAEKHLILGTKDSPEVLTRMEYTWYKEDDSHTAPLYAARAVLPYLLVANVRAANTSYRAFTSALTSDKKDLSVQDVSSQNSDVRVFPSLPLLNFLGLLLLAVQRGSPDLFRQLRNKYAPNINELGGAWDTALEMIAEMYFGIQRPRQSNPLFDMMGSLFGGGGGGGGPPGGRPAARRVEAPTAEGLD